MAKSAGYEGGATTGKERRSVVFEVIEPPFSKRSRGLPVLAIVPDIFPDDPTAEENVVTLPETVDESALYAGRSLTGNVNASAQTAEELDPRYLRLVRNSATPSSSWSGSWD